MEVDNDPLEDDFPLPLSSLWTAALQLLQCPEELGVLGQELRSDERSTKWQVGGKEGPSKSSESLSLSLSLGSVWPAMQPDAKQGHAVRKDETLPCQPVHLNA